MFKNLDFLGWYTTGSSPTENDIRVHKQVAFIKFCRFLLNIIFNRKLKTESIRKLGNINFSWTKIEYLNNLHPIALFSTIFKS